MRLTSTKGRLQVARISAVGLLSATSVHLYNAPPINTFPIKFFNAAEIADRVISAIDSIAKALDLCWIFFN